MENILLVLIVGGINLLSFYLGSKANRKVEKEQKEMTINPVKMYQKAKEEKKIKEEKEREQQILTANLENIENYSGDGIGQRDIP